MDQNRQNIDKTSARLLFVIGVLVFAAGIYQLRFNLFAVDRGLELRRDDIIASSETLSGSANTLEGSQEANDLANLQETDSDQDGLTDFEELYVRGTSPYLQDTDSDGTSDFEEIANNTDPNCPEGQNCTQERVGGDEVINQAEQKLLESGDLTPTSSTVNEDTVLDAPELTNDEVRQYLLDNGIAEDQVNSVPEDDLQELYNTLYQQTQEASTDSQELDTDQVQSEVEALLSLSTAERRQYLIDSGVSQDEVDDLTDEQVDASFTASIQDALLELGITIN